MKHLRAFMIILGISFAGEICRHFVPLPIPASIYGMILLFVLLATGAVKLDTVKDTGHFLVNIMAVLFVCPAVGLLDCWQVLRSHWLAILVITVVSLLITFAVSGRVTQWMIGKKGESEDA